ncbi:MAG TPA: dihydroorotase [Polyangiaceae bacterium]
MPGRENLLIFRNVRAIDPGRGLDERVDIVVERGHIVRLGPDAAAELRATDARIVDGSGRWVLPAFVDLHAHLREPGHEYKEDIASGLRAAAAGGYAHVCVMPNTSPVNDTRAVTEMMLRRATECAGPELHPIAAITVGLEGRELTEMAELKQAGAVAVSDDGRCVMSAAVMRRALEYAKNFGLTVIQHAEDHELTAGATMHEGEVSARLGLRGWPRVAEDIIVARDVLLAKYTGARYHVAHISTRDSVSIVREAKHRGLPVTCEVTPHHLLLSDQAVLGYDTACRVNPPLREPEDVERLQSALADGTIDAIATDHAPQATTEKDCEFTSALPGIIGLELCFGVLMQLVREKRVKLERLVDALTVRPARIAGIDAPTLRVDAPAELVLVDPEARWTLDKSSLRSKSHNTPFLGRELTGRVLMTLARGHAVFDALTRDDQPRNPG